MTTPAARGERWPGNGRSAGGSDGSAANLRQVRTVAGKPAGLGALARGVLRRKGGRGDLPAVEYRADDHGFDPAALAGYQRLCCFRVSSRVPSTFVHVQTFPLSLALMGARDFPLPLIGLVHVHNRITQYRPIDASETIDLRVWADDLRDHPAGRPVDLEAEAHIAGETVWRGTSTYLQRSGAPAPRGERRDISVPPAPIAFWPLPANLGRRYGAVSGDRNPIHLSRVSAKAFGFPRAIAHGMWMHARVLGALEARLPDSYTVDVAFKTPAFLPSTVAFEAEQTPDGWRLGLRNARTGKPHLAATIRPPTS